MSRLDPDLDAINDEHLTTDQWIAILQIQATRDIAAAINRQTDLMPTAER